MAPQFTIHQHSKASPEQIYDLLADPISHLVWNGSDQVSNFRLLTVQSEPGLAGVGSTFASTGNIPFSSRTWADRSTVTQADRDHVFEFRTDGTVVFQNGDHMEATFLHRYGIEPEADGSRITYTMKLLSMKNGMWRLSLPILRDLIWRVGLPMATKPGLQALARRAESRLAEDTTSTILPA